ncbi:MAG: 50S ribosomal protein L29 [Candidatus Neomarinimicrobiota bacterium]|nr:MAG: 50S ribosomal protein L29 [Candidatus Marinimicrobia bacterium TMED108]RCL90305.1 MAG: 50S ribosomal protein L29 [bacterium]|tara:strand:+ start:518 stop:733 length:216 start_codon:yes stop_codon:yes gene_type:complete
MKKSDLKDLSMDDINNKIKDNESKLQSLRFQKALQQLEDPLEIRSLKKEIAQLLTLKNEHLKGIRLDKESA